MSEFGLYLNYAPGFGNPPVIATLDQFGVVITSFDLSAVAPISTPGGFNQFEFRGIDEGSNVIWGLRLGGSYLLAAATASGDPTPNPTPEPGTLMLLGLALAAVTIRRKA